MSTFEYNQLSTEMTKSTYILYSKVLMDSFLMVKVIKLMIHSWHKFVSHGQKTGLRMAWTRNLSSIIKLFDIDVALVYSRSTFFSPMERNEKFSIIIPFHPTWSPESKIWFDYFGSDKWRMARASKEKLKTA
jgi:hypothetical protein